MKTSVSLIVLIVGSVLALLGAANFPKGGEGSRDVSNRNEDAVLKYLRLVIGTSGKTIRLYYSASSCHVGNDQAPVPFPAVKLRPPSKEKIGLAAVREIFSDDKSVTVSEEPLGTIRVLIGKVPMSILQTKLPLIALDPLERYNQRMAINAIQSAKEVQTAMHSLGLMPVSNLGGLIAEPAKGLPHLPASMKELTVDRALDVVASTFQNVVVYGVCPNPTGPDGEKLFWIE